MFFLNGEVSELAEGARLEIVLVGKTCHVGSNPTLSARVKTLIPRELVLFWPC